MVCAIPEEAKAETQKKEKKMKFKNYEIKKEKIKECGENDFLFAEKISKKSKEYYVLSDGDFKIKYPCKRWEFSRVKKIANKLFDTKKGAKDELLDIFTGRQ
jgi:hypothetical protein